MPCATFVEWPIGIGIGYFLNTVVGRKLCSKIMQRLTRSGTVTNKFVFFGLGRNNLGATGLPESSGSRGVVVSQVISGTGLEKIKKNIAAGGIAALVLCSNAIRPFAGLTVTVKNRMCKSIFRASRVETGTCGSGAPLPGSIIENLPNQQAFQSGAFDAVQNNQTFCPAMSCVIEKLQKFGGIKSEEVFSGSTNSGCASLPLSGRRMNPTCKTSALNDGPTVTINQAVSGFGKVENHFHTDESGNGDRYKRRLEGALAGSLFTAWLLQDNKKKNAKQAA